MGIVIVLTAFVLLIAIGCFIGCFLEHGFDIKKYNKWSENDNGW